jgi:uncharacterized protein (TIGR03437 family)
MSPLEDIMLKSLRYKIPVAALFLSVGLAAQGQIISMSASSSSWSNVLQVAVDSVGNQYVVDEGYHVAYRFDRFGTLTTIAGQYNFAGTTGDNGPASQSRLANPYGIAVGPDGSVYISDYSGRIRRIAPNGIISTFAGRTYERGFSGDGGPATNALLSDQPAQLVFDSVGNLYFTDRQRVRRITRAGIISTVAGTGFAGFPAGTGELATAAHMTPCYLAIGPDDTLYISTCRAPFKVYRRLANGTLRTVAGNGEQRTSGDGGPATSASLQSAYGIGLDRSGNLYIADPFGHSIRKVSADGTISHFAGSDGAGNAGNGGPAVTAQLYYPAGLTVGPDDVVYFVERGVQVRKITPALGPTLNSTNAANPAFLGKAGFTSNSYLELFGSDFSTTTRTWAGADFRGSNAPTSLDGVSVTVNGRDAFIYYVSPSQININVPEDTAVGPVNIQVRNATGTSNTLSVNRTRLAPTLHAIPQFTVGGRAHVVAQTPDFRSFVGNPGMVTGIAFTAARPGQTVVVYALGCGPTSPATVPGAVNAANAPLALPSEVRIGGQRAAVAFAGAVANTIGLYQFNVVIPEIAPGDQPIELTVDGVPNNQNLVIAVGAR